MWLRGLSYVAQQGKTNITRLGRVAVIGQLVTVGNPTSEN